MALRPEASARSQYRYFRSQESNQLEEGPLAKSDHLLVRKSYLTNLSRPVLAAISVSGVGQKGPILPCESGTRDSLPLCKSMVCTSRLASLPIGAPGTAEVKTSDFPSGDHAPEPRPSAIFRGIPPCMLTRYCPKPSVRLKPLKATVSPSGERRGYDTDRGAKLS